MKKVIICLLALAIIAFIYGLSTAIKSGFTSSNLTYLSSTIILVIVFSYRLYRVTRSNYNDSEGKELKLALIGLLGGLLLGYILIKITLMSM